MDNNSDKTSSRLMQLYQQSTQLRQQEKSLFTQLSQLDLRYLPRESIGYGGMKEIIHCRDEATGRSVARATLKQSDSNQNIEQFLREARITASLQHPNIVPIYDIGIDEQQKPFFIMKLLDGKNMAAHLKQNKPSLEQRIDIFRKICEAMTYAHSHGVIHLDLKPENIQIGEFGEVTICDWGLARLSCAESEDKSLLEDEWLEQAESGQTRHGEIKGTPGYMSPEQIENSTAAKGFSCDVYALGGLLYFLILKRPPIEGKDFEEVRRNTLSGRINWEQKDEDQIMHPSLFAVCRKALALAPEQRYPSVKSLLTEIESWQHGFATLAEQASLGRQLKLFYKRNRLTCLLSLSFISFALIYGAYFLREKNRNLQEIRQQKQQAEENLQAFLNEKEVSEKKSQSIALPQLKDAQKDYIELRLPQAMAKLDLALKTIPDEIYANSLKGKLLFLQYRFKEATPYFHKGTAFYRKYYAESGMCEDLSKHVDLQSGKLNPERFLKLVKETWATNTVTRYMMHDMVNSVKSQEAKVDFALQILRIRNKARPQLRIVYDAKTNSLDLSGNPFLENIDALATLPLNSLNLSGTAIADFSALHDKRLIELDLSYCAISDLTQLKLHGLKRLNVAHTYIRKLDDIPWQELEFLDIRNTPILDVYRLRHSTKLQHLLLSEDYYPPSQVKNWRQYFRVNGKAKIKK